MITIEECKECVGQLNLTDEQIEEVRGLLYAFAEKVLDFEVESGTFVLEEKKLKQHESKKHRGVKGFDLLQGVVGASEK